MSRIQLSHKKFYELVSWMKANADTLIDRPRTYGQIAEIATSGVGFEISTNSIRPALEAAELLDKLPRAVSAEKLADMTQMARDVLCLARHIDALFAGTGRGHPKELVEMIARLSGRKSPQADEKAQGAG